MAYAGMSHIILCLLVYCNNYKKHMIHLDPREASALQELILGVTASPVAAPDDFIAQAREAARDVPERLRTAIERFGEHGSPTGFLLISGIPVDDSSIPPTPPSNASHAGSRTDLARIQAILNQTVGEMIAYEAEGGGKLFQDMAPNSALSKTQTSLGSDVALEIHTEQAFSELRPDVLSLACLRGDAMAKTYTLHVRQILDHVTEREAALLRLPLWTIGVDASFVMSGLLNGNSDMRGPMPILEGSDEDPTLVFDQDLMRSVDDAGEELRAKLVSLYYEHRHEHVLSPGDIMFVDNRRAVHGRSAFRPKFDGSDRFIVRSFVVHDYARSEHARIGRTVQASFS